MQTYLDKDLRIIDYLLEQKRKAASGTLDFLRMPGRIRCGTFSAAIRLL
jgi:hypothetical protein